MLTLIEAGHAPVTEVVMPLDNLGPLAARLGTRIANWTPSRPGDPLDVPQWRTFTSTLHAVLSQRLGADDHVVVIESPQLYRLPWHLALGPSWTCSYAPSWGSLMLRPDAPVARPAVGAVCAPRFGESRAVEAALTASLAASRAEAAAAELVFASADREHADAAALVRILESSDLCTLLCHGMVDTGSASVSLLLSSEGRRPPGDSLAAARSGLAAHRFDWRSATAVSRSPSAIFSAACSSGLNHPAAASRSACSAPCATVACAPWSRRAGTSSPSRCCRSSTAAAPSYCPAARRALPCVRPVWKRNSPAYPDGSPGRWLWKVTGR